MKNCPKCGAKIQENARFCLYCMTSFEEKEPIKTSYTKNNRHGIIIAVILSFVILFSGSIAVFYAFDGWGSSNSSTDNSQNQSDDSDNLGTEETNKAPNNNSTQDGEHTQTSGGNDLQTPPNSNNQNNENSGNGNNNTNNTDNNGTENNGTDTPDVSTPKFSYVEATLENTFPTGYSSNFAPENAIVITKVDYIETSGNYVIPDTIDGKKVAAIMPDAFCDSKISQTVKSVTLPSTVRTIWGGAFKNCYYLSDIYIKSSVIAIFEDTFPDVSKRNNNLTIHCKRDCRDFNFYYYRNIANKYNAEYKEWNG